MSDAAERVVEVPEAGRFELRRGDEVLGWATYHVDEHDVVVIPHVETRAELRGQGIGDRTVAGTLELIRASGRKVRPVCSFAAAHLRSRPEMQDLLA